MTNPPSVPSLDVAACVRLLGIAADRHERHARRLEKSGYIGEGPDGERSNASQLRALASALPGMGKDSERLDAVAMLGLTVEPRGGKASGEWIAYRFPTSSAEEVLASRSPDPRAAIDRHITARAAQPQETSADG